LDSYPTPETFILILRTFDPYLRQFFNGSFATSSGSFLAGHGVAPTGGWLWMNLKVSANKRRRRRSTATA